MARPRKQGEKTMARAEPKVSKVIETSANGRTVWKSAPGSKVAFYASAANSPQGALELSIAAVEAFKLKGEDRVLVFEVTETGAFQIANIVHVGAPEFWRNFIAELEAKRVAA
jgi:hypothetical protein